MTTMTSQEWIDKTKCNTHNEDWHFPRRTYRCGCVMSKHLWQSRMAAVEKAQQEEDKNALQD